MNNSSHLLAFSPCLTHIYPFFYLSFNNQVRLDYRKRSSSFRCIPFPLRFKNQIKFSILENYSSYLCSCTILLPSISLFIFFFLYSNIPFSLCFNNQVRLNRKYLPSQFFILLAYQFLSRYIPSSPIFPSLSSQQSTLFPSPSFQIRSNQIQTITSKPSINSKKKYNINSTPYFPSNIYSKSNLLPLFHS